MIGYAPIMMRVLVGEMLDIELTRGEVVRTLRIRKKLSRSNLAKEAGLSRNYIAKIEADTANNLSERVLFALADALGVNASQLLRRPE